MCETILLVDNDPGVRSTVRSILEDSGYHILEAANANDALQTSRSYVGQIRVLLTDSRLPEMSGRELAGILVAERPELTVVLMTANYPLVRTTLPRPWRSLPKPFRAQDVRVAVWLALEMVPNDLVVKS